MNDFSDKLSVLVSGEMSESEDDPDRQAVVLERLLHSASFTIALMAKGDAKTTDELLMGAESYLTEGSVCFAKVGELFG